MYRSKIAFYYYFTNLSLNVISKISQFHTIPTLGFILDKLGVIIMYRYECESLYT